MNHSIITADRTTNLKIVVVALVGAIAVASVGIGARLSTSGVDLGTDVVAKGPIEQPMKVGVVKAAKPVTWTSSGTSAVR
jgi:hypothetical protein